MPKHFPNTKMPVVFPLRLTELQYRQLAQLAEREERTRCAVIRELINRAARRVPKLGGS